MPTRYEVQAAVDVLKDAYREMYRRQLDRYKARRAALVTLVREGRAKAGFTEKDAEERARFEFENMNYSLRRLTADKLFALTRKADVHGHLVPYVKGGLRPLPNPWTLQEHEALRERTPS